jgi:hypothetical protein
VNCWLDIVRVKSGIVQVRSDIVRWDRTLSAERSLKMCFSPKILSFLSKFDSCTIDTKSDEIWTQGSPQHNEQVHKRGFSEIQRCLFRFGMN